MYAARTVTSSKGNMEQHERKTYTALQRQMRTSGFKHLHSMSPGTVATSTCEMAVAPSGGVLFLSPRGGYIYSRKQKIP